MPFCRDLQCYRHDCHVIHEENDDNDDNDTENTLKERSLRCVLFETLVAFLTIENNNHIIHSDPSIKSDRGLHLQFLQ